MNETRREINERNRRTLLAVEWAERYRLPKDWMPLLDLYPGITVGEIADQLQNISEKKGKR